MDLFIAHLHTKRVSSLMFQKMTSNLHIMSVILNFNSKTKNYLKNVFHHSRYPKEKRYFSKSEFINHLAFQYSGNGVEFVKAEGGCVYENMYVKEKEG